MARLQDNALSWGADAVIGIRLSQLTSPGASRLFRAGWFGHRKNLVVAIAIGSTVGQLSEEDTDNTNDVG